MNLLHRIKHWLWFAPSMAVAFRDEDGELWMTVKCVKCGMVTNRWKIPKRSYQ